MACRFESGHRHQKGRHASACLPFWCAVCRADCDACGRELNAKETPDGFLSHYLSVKTKLHVHLYCSENTRRRGLHKSATTFFMLCIKKPSLTRFVAPPLKIVTANAGLRFCFFIWHCSMISVQHIAADLPPRRFFIPFSILLYIVMAHDRKHSPGRARIWDHSALAS